MIAPVYYTQRDSKSGHAHRKCFASCSAMVVATYRRDEGKTAQSEDPNWDDEYLKRVFVYGDTTSYIAQQRALKYYGYRSSMHFDADFEDMAHWLASGNLAPCGMLHHGNIGQPGGGGHYVLPYALNDDFLRVHDPYFEQDLVNGGFIRGASGKAVAYSRENFGKRWMVPSGSTGWALVVHRK